MTTLQLQVDRRQSMSLWSGTPPSWEPSSRLNLCQGATEAQTYRTLESTLLILAVLAYLRASRPPTTRVVRFQSGATVIHWAS